MERIVRSEDGKGHVVIGMGGGFLGLGEKRIAIPEDNVILRGDRLVVEGMTDDQLKRIPAFDINNRTFHEVDGNTTIRVSAR